MLKCRIYCEKAEQHRTLPECIFFHLCQHREAEEKPELPLARLLYLVVFFFKLLRRDPATSRASLTWQVDLIHTVQAEMLQRAIIALLALCKAETTVWGKLPGAVAQSSNMR